MDKVTEKELIGKWRTDPDDLESIQEYGSVFLEFRTDGSLIYTILNENTEQKIILTYKIENGVIITDQPSSPNIEKTPYTITANQKLLLSYDGYTTSYVRE
jgi:hypothetical protein